MLVLGGYETLIIVTVLVLMVFGPVVAGGILAFVRRARAKLRGKRGKEG